MKEDNIVAATLAAALIKGLGADMANVKHKPAEVAATIYFDCVAALKEESKRRNPGLSADALKRAAQLTGRR